MALVFDLEANGLLDTATTVHCLSTYDTMTNEACSYYGDTLLQGLDLLMSADKIVGHNVFGYDLPLIEKLYGMRPVGVVHDTLILSQMLFANEMDNAGHSIEAWGKVFEVPKPKHNDWSKFSEEMLYRNKEDVKITVRLWKKVNEAIRRTGLNFSDARDMEYRLYQIMSKSFDRGWEFDVPRALILRDRLDFICEGLIQRIVDRLPLRCNQVKTLTNIFKKDGTYTKSFLNQGLNFQVKGPVTLVEFVKPKPSSHVQIKDALLRIGWQPEEYTDKGSPKLTGEFKGIDPELAKLLSAYNVRVHRLRTIVGWLKEENMGRVKYHALTTGCNTARWKHRTIVNIPSPGKAYLGWHLTSLWTCPPDKVLVGADFSALESRVEGSLTHKYDGGKYARFLLEEDVHSHNATVFGCSRADAKNVGFALLFGASAGKIAKYLGCSTERAKELYEDYWDSKPAAKQLKQELERFIEGQGYRKSDDLWAKRAYLKGLDGRPIFVRSWHSLVNSAIQSAGAIIAKRSVVILHDLLRERGIDATIIMLYHDNIEVICNPEDGGKVLELTKLSMLRAGEYYNLKVPFTAEGSIGKTWAETH